MPKKKIIFITIGIVCGVILTYFLYNGSNNSYTQITYKGTIHNNDTTVVENIFSGDISLSLSGDYNINHTIRIKEDSNDIIILSIRQEKNQGNETTVLKDFLTQTGQGNHRLTIFTKEILQKSKNITLPGPSQISGLIYNITTNHGLLVDTTTITGTYTNQFDQQNKYIIILNNNCGIGQYMSKEWTCDIYGKIQLDLPIQTYTNERIIEGTLHKSNI